MNVLGIDLGTRHFAMCFMSSNGIYHLEELNLSKEKSHKKRRKMTWNLLQDLDDDPHIVRPDIVVLEKVMLFHKSHISIDAIKRLGGLTYLIVDYYDCPTYEIATMSWKKLVLGSGKASKQDAVDYVGQKYNVITTNDNLADAICIARCGLDHFNKLKEVE